jgi:hypothetical protein
LKQSKNFRTDGDFPGLNDNRRGAGDFRWQAPKRHVPAAVLPAGLGRGIVATP